MGPESAQAGHGDDAPREPRDARGSPVENDVAGHGRAGDRFRPTLLVNPPTDTRLRTTLDAMLDEHAPATPSELQALVRPDYPRIVVRARQLEHESLIVWYVYREGYWVPAATDGAAGQAR